MKQYRKGTDKDNKAILQSLLSLHTTKKAFIREGVVYYETTY